MCGKAEKKPNPTRSITPGLVPKGGFHLTTVGDWYRLGHFRTVEMAAGAFELAYQQWKDGLGDCTAEVWMGLSPAQYRDWHGAGIMPPLPRKHRKTRVPWLRPKKRPAFSRRQRFRILKRDGFRCQYCGKVVADLPKGVELDVYVRDSAHLDHMTPVSYGGEHEDENLITACQLCNSGKAKTKVAREELK